MMVVFIRDLIVKRISIALRARKSVACRTVGPICKNPSKIRLEKFVKFTDHTNAYNSLTNFDYIKRMK